MMYYDSARKKILGCNNGKFHLCVDLRTIMWELWIFQTSCFKNILGGGQGNA